MVMGESAEHLTAISDEQVLLSEAYRQYLQRVVRTVSGRYELEVRFSGNVQTDGRLIEVDPLSPWLSPLPNLEQKTLAILGQLVHEFFHIEYSDFRAYRLLAAKYRSASEFRRQAAYRLFNMIEDGVIERIGCGHYVGLFRRAMHFANHVAFSQMPSIQVMQRKDAPGFQVLSQASLMYVIMDRIKGDWLDPKLEQTFEQSKAILDRGKAAKDSMGRYHCAEELFALFEPWIAEMEHAGQTSDRSFQYVKNERAPKLGQADVPGVGGLTAQDLPHPLPPGEQPPLLTEDGMETEAKPRETRKDQDGLSWDDEAGHSPKPGNRRHEPDRSTTDRQATLPHRLIKWFRFGKRKRPEGKESRSMGDAESFRPGGELIGEGIFKKHKTFSDPPSGQESGDSMETTGSGWAGWDRQVEEAIRQLEQVIKDVRSGALRELRQSDRHRERMALLSQQGQRLATGLHQGIRISTRHRFTLKPEEEQLYRELAEEIRPLERMMVRHWQALLQEDGGMRESGLYHGKWDDRRLWREDARVFYRRIDQGDAPSLAVLVLVDESGSMKEQDRWKHAIRACLLLEGVCRQCRIPFAAMGHLAVYGSPQVVHHHYIDFDSRRGGERKNLALLGPKENTREGLALRYAGMYIRQARDTGLLGDPTRVKPFILVLADGEPVHEVEGVALKGEAAQEDARLAVRELERQGIGVIGVAIGDAPSAIGRIYSRCLEVQRLDMLPQRLLRQVMLAMGWPV